MVNLNDPFLPIPAHGHQVYRRRRLLIHPEDSCTGNPAAICGCSRQLLGKGSHVWGQDGPVLSELRQGQQLAEYPRLTAPQATSEKGCERSTAGLVGASSSLALLSSTVNRILSAGAEVSGSARAPQCSLRSTPPL